MHSCGVQRRDRRAIQAFGSSSSPHEWFRLAIQPSLVRFPFPVVGARAVRCRPNGLRALTVLNPKRKEPASVPQSEAPQARDGGRV